MPRGSTERTPRRSEAVVKPFKIPKDVAICPICKARLWVAEVTGCTQEDNGDWTPDEIGIECDKEPRIESRKWEEWFNWHYRMPYVDWLPVHAKVEAWVKKTYKVIDGPDGRELVKLEQQPQ